MGWSKLVDMELDDEDKLDHPMPMPFDRPDYPCGLKICLTQRELKKLDLQADCSIGDMIDLRAFAVVTSVSTNETEGGQECRVELQIQKIAVEDEMSEREG